MHPSLSEKSSFGVIMEHVQTQDEHAGKNVFDSPKSSLSNNESDENLPKIPIRPCPVARGSSFGTLKVDTSVANNGDIEKGLLVPQSSRNSAHSPLYEPCREYNVGSSVKECTMWPSRQTLKTKAKQEKTHRRGSTCFGLSKKWGSLTRKQRIAFHLLFVLIVLSLGVGVAIGISRAVHGTVYGGKSGSKQIPGSN